MLPRGSSGHVLTSSSRWWYSAPTQIAYRRYDVCRTNVLGCPVGVSPALGRAAGSRAAPVGYRGQVVLSTGPGPSRHPRISRGGSLSGRCGIRGRRVVRRDGSCDRVPVAVRRRSGGPYDRSPRSGYWIRGSRTAIRRAGADERGSDRGDGGVGWTSSRPPRTVRTRSSMSPSAFRDAIAPRSPDSPTGPAGGVAPGTNS